MSLDDNIQIISDIAKKETTATETFNIIIPAAVQNEEYNAINLVEIVEKCSNASNYQIT